MMFQRCFSVYDAKTAYFQPPFFSPTIPSGVRMFQRLVNDPGSMVYSYPQDFSLMFVGEFDDTTGQLRAVTPEIVATGSQMRERLVSDDNQMALPVSSSK